MATTSAPEAPSAKKIPVEKKSFCCPRFRCGKVQDHGYIEGEEYVLHNEELEPLTTYFHNSLYTRKSIKGTKTAIDFYERSLTFNELSTFSTAISMQLIERVTFDDGSAPGGDVIFAICLPLSEKLIPTIFAILKTGAAYLPLDPHWPEPVLLSIIEHFGPKALITDESGPILCKYNPEDFSDMCTVISIEELWLNIEIPSGKTKGRGNKFANLAEKMRRPSVFRKVPSTYEFITSSAASTKDRLAVVIQSLRLVSDNPQGVRISHMNIMNRLSWGWRKLPFAKNGTCCLTVPVSTTESISQIFAPLLKGITVHVLARRDMKMMGDFIRVIGNKEITRISLSPTVFHHFINECAIIKRSELNRLLKHLKYVICRGRLATRENIEQFLEIFPSGKLLCSLYGHPELTGDVICEKFKGMADVERNTVAGRLVVGKTLPNTRIYVLDSNLNQAEEGEQGQICVSGLPVVLGYVNPTPVDAHLFATNPLNLDHHADFTRLFCTGDYGRMIRCPDRQLRLLIEGRKDNLIHHQGNDFFMDDVESTLLTMEEVEKVQLQLVHPGNYDQSVVAYVVLKKKYKDSIVGEFDFKLRSKLPEFMIPEVVFVDQIPTVIGTERVSVDAGKLLQSYDVIAGMSSNERVANKMPQKLL